MNIRDGLAALRAAGWMEAFTSDGHRILTSPDGRRRVKTSVGSRKGRLTNDAPGWLKQ